MEHNVRKKCPYDSEFLDNVFDEAYKHYYYCNYCERIFSEDLTRFGYKWKNGRPVLDQEVREEGGQEWEESCLG